LNSQTAGAVVVIIFNEGQPGPTDVIGGTLGSPDLTIPVVDTTFALGADTYDRITSLGQTVVTHLASETISDTHTSSTNTGG
jgi:hypothetical protein